MQFIPDNLYHVYNRGNNRQKIFFNHDNYKFFIDKIKKYLCPNAQFLAWCLMPNHFHFLILSNESTSRIVKEFPIRINGFTEGIRLGLSSYAKAIKVQENRSGNLFQQKTKCKLIDNQDYGLTAFHYIHQNPYRAGLVKSLEDWQFSSYQDYVGIRNEDYFDFCDQETAFNMLDITRETLYKDSYRIMRDDLVNKIF